MEKYQDILNEYYNFIPKIDQIVSSNIESVKDNLFFSFNYSFYYHWMGKFRYIGEFTSQMFRIWDSVCYCFVEYIKKFHPNRETVQKDFELIKKLGNEILNYYPHYLKDIQRIYDFKNFVMRKQKSKTLWEKVFGYKIPDEILNDKKLTEECYPPPDNIVIEATNYVLMRIDQVNPRPRGIIVCDNSRSKEKNQNKQSLKPEPKMNNVQIETYNYHDHNPIKRLYQPLNPDYVN